MAPMYPSLSARRFPKKDSRDSVDHVPSRDSKICIQTGFPFSSVEITNDSCTEDYFMQRYQRVSDVI